MIELESKYFKDKASFRGWLEKNFDKSPGIWLIFYKKHVNLDCVKYQDALRAALCFGWIDSIIKRIDNDQYIRKFTPRINTGNWSELNRKIVMELIEQGEMTEAGLAKIDLYQKTGKVDWKIESHKAKCTKEFAVPDFILKEFAANEPALKNFTNLARTYQRHYLLWITSAKKEETINARLNEAVELLKKNRKLPLK